MLWSSEERSVESAYSIQGGGIAHLVLHLAPHGLEHLNLHVELVLVEEMHHALANAVRPPQALMRASAYTLAFDLGVL